MAVYRSAPYLRCRDASSPFRWAGCTGTDHRRGDPVRGDAPAATASGRRRVRPPGDYDAASLGTDRHHAPPGPRPAPPRVATTGGTVGASNGNRHDVAQTPAGRLSDGGNAP